MALAWLDVFSVSGNDGRIQLAGVDEKIRCRGSSYQAQQHTLARLDLNQLWIVNRPAIGQECVILYIDVGWRSLHFLRNQPFRGWIPLLHDKGFFLFRHAHRLWVRRSFVLLLPFHALRFSHETFEDVLGTRE